MMTMHWPAEWNANVTISDPFDSLTVLGFINIKEFILDAQPIGNINLTATRIFFRILI